MGDTHKDMLGAVQGGGAPVWMLAGASWASAAPGLGQHPPLQWECVRQGCARICPSLPEYEVLIMKAGEGCLK